MSSTPRVSWLLRTRGRAARVSCVNFGLGVPYILNRNSRVLQAQKQSAVQGLDQAPLTYVDTLDGLRDMAARLGDARELAVDLENHSYRSFQACGGHF